MEHHQNEKVNFTIDGIPVTAPAGTTIMEAAKKINVDIPTLCDYPDLCKRALCRLCVVECDGKGKLMAACATEVWEGVSIETNTFRILNIRKTILELLLANHPDECLSCIKNRNCELQKFAIIYGIRGSSYKHVGQPKPRKVSAETMAMDMGKCVKCGRCVEICQELQGIGAINSSHRSNNYKISTPYAQDLNEGPCVFCGRCVASCPVGAIYHHDQTKEVRDALNDREKFAAAQVAPSAAAALAVEAGLPPGSVTTGKITGALKTLGFKKVYDADFSADLAIREKANELAKRLKNNGKLPVITSCSSGWMNFIKHEFPELIDNHLPYINTELSFGSFAKKNLSNAETDPEKIIPVSFGPCLARKYGVKYSLILAELVQLMFTKGIEIQSQQEEQFDEFEKPADDPSFSALRTVLRNKNPECITETEINMDGKKIKILTVNGIANARKVMETIREGKCDAALVDVRYCKECKLSI